MKLPPLILQHFSVPESDLLPGIKAAKCTNYLNLLRAKSLNLKVEIELLKLYSKFLAENLNLHPFVKIEGDALTLYTLDSANEILDSATFKPQLLSEDLVKLFTFKHTQTLGLPFKYDVKETLITWS